MTKSNFKPIEQIVDIRVDTNLTNLDEPPKARILFAEGIRLRIPLPVIGYIEDSQRDVQELGYRLYETAEKYAVHYAAVFNFWATAEEVRQNKLYVRSCLLNTLRTSESFAAINKPLLADDESDKKYQIQFRPGKLDADNHSVLNYRNGVGIEIPMTQADECWKAWLNRILITWYLRGIGFTDFSVEDLDFHL